MSKGKLITFEGIDGCGKSTMLHLAEQELLAKGFAVVATREPGGSDFGRAFRKMLLDSELGQIDERTETLLYGADRARHVETVIKPALAQGKIVLCDRYQDSTLAYQGGGRGLDLTLLQTLNRFATAGLEPDRTFFLQFPPQRMHTRLRGEKDRLEQEDLQFFVRVDQQYQKLAIEDPQRISVIDATGDITTVFSQIKTQIGELLLWK